jgi:hypothetical protein
MVWLCPFVHSHGSIHTPTPQRILPSSQRLLFLICYERSFFLIKDIDPASIPTSGYIGSTNTREHSDSKPRTEVKRKKLENTTTTKKKKKTKLLKLRPNFQRHDDTAPQATKAHDFQSDALKKETTSMPPPSLLRINEQMFPPGRHEPKQEASQHNASKEGHDARRRRRC